MTAQHPPTWGLTGPTFLAIYIALTAAVVLAVYLLRRALAGRGDAVTAIDPSTLDACDLALMNEGETLAVAAAVAELDKAGAVEYGSDGSAALNALPGSFAGLDPLERACLDQLRDAPGSTIDQLGDSTSVSSALESMRERLVTGGLLLTEAQRTQIRRQAVWVVALIALGVVRIVAGIRNDKPVGLLVLLVGVVSLAVLRWSRTAPHATRSGAEVLSAMRRRPGGVRKDVAPGDPRLGLAVALFGATALWSAEPTLADALGLPRSRGGGDGGGGCGGGCGSCGG